MLGSSILTNTQRRQRKAKNLEFDWLESRETPAGLLAVGSGSGMPTVLLYDAETREQIAQFQPFTAAEASGVRVAIGDVNLDGVDDIICAAGGGRGRGHVKVFDGTNLQPLEGTLGGFFAFGDNFKGSAYVAAGDVNYDGFFDIIVAAQDGRSSNRSRQVKVISGEDGAELAAFDAYALTSSSGRSRIDGLGIRVATEDFNGDGVMDIVTAASSGRQQKVAIVSLANGQPETLATLDFLTTRDSQGVFLAAADQNRDIRPELLISHSGKVQIFEMTAGGLNLLREQDLPGNSTRAVPIAGLDWNLDDQTDIVLANSAVHQRPLTILNGGTSVVDDLFSLAPTGYRGGVHLAGTGRESFNPLLRRTVAAENILLRLGQYDSTNQTFSSVGAATSFHGKNVYIVAHGWAPDWQNAVAQYAKDHPGDYLKWWQTTDLALPKRPTTEAASYWMFSGTTGPSPDNLPISAEGLAQTIVDADPNAVVVAYSWIDESASAETSPYISEAYTLRNGLRMGQAVQQMLGSAHDFNTSGGKLHVMGHSHGAKVATIGAVQLQRAGYSLPHLSLHDSADSNSTDTLDATNFAWYFLQDLAISKNPLGSSGGTFVDNYISEFSRFFSRFPGLENVVDVLLQANIVFPDDPGDEHSYAMTWYSGGSVAPVQLGQNGVALGWSPLLHPTVSPTLNTWYKQTWSQPTEATQFVLDSHGPADPQVLITGQIGLTNVQTTGAGSFDNGTVTLNSGISRANSSVKGTMNPPSSAEAFTFEFEFTNAQPGDQLVISIGGYWSTYQYFLVDAAQAANGVVYKATISVGGDSFPNPVTFAMNSPTNANASVRVTNLQYLEINGSVDPS